MQCFCFVLQLLSQFRVSSASQEIRCKAFCTVSGLKSSDCNLFCNSFKLTQMRRDCWQFEFHNFAKCKTEFDCGFHLSCASLTSTTGPKFSDRDREKEIESENTRSNNRWTALSTPRILSPTPLTDNHFGISVICCSVEPQLEFIQDVNGRFGSRSCELICCFAPNGTEI